MENKEEKLELELTLIAWHNFYAKCHEVENKIDVVDTERGNSSDLNYLPDITERAFYFSNNTKEKYLENIKYKVINKGINAEQNTYNQYIQAVNKEANSAKIRKNTIGIVMVLFEVICVIVAVIQGAKTNDFNKVLGYLFASAILACAISMGVYFVFLQLEKRRKPMKKYVNITEWFQEVKFTPNSKYYGELQKVNDKFNKNLDSYIAYSKNEIAALSEIKKQLKEKFPLPEKYSDEYHVNALLSLLLDCRADTLKEAINLFEEERFRSQVLQSLDLLNYNVMRLNNQLAQLRSDVNMVSNQLNFAITQNSIINQNLQSINLSTRFLMIDELFD